MKLDDICRALKALELEKDWPERYRLLESLRPEYRRELIALFGLLPRDARARERVLSSMEPDRRFEIELDDLMGRFRRMVSDVFNQTDGKIEVDFLPMYGKLVRHASYMLRRMYPNEPDLDVSARKAAEELEDMERRKQEPPSSQQSNFPPLPEDKQRQMVNATWLELIDMWDERTIFGTFFRGKYKCTGRGRPPDREIEFRSKCIAAFTYFREREGEHRKNAIRDAMNRYAVSKTTVEEARKQWCGEMHYLQFDAATAKKYRESLERVEAHYAARSSHKIWEHLKPNGSVCYGPKNSVN
jgi:hypothetical protein